MRKGDRTGTGTISVFGRVIRHKMSEGFPLLTTKKMAFKQIATELIWFLRGDTNIKYLVDNNCHIWDGDAYKRYENYHNNHPTIHSNRFDILSKEDFINKIKSDPEFASKWGDLGPIYGKQWRKWDKKLKKTFNNREEWIEKEDYIDQIEQLIHDLKNNPDSRRLMVNAWNPAELS